MDDNNLTLKSIAGYRKEECPDENSVVEPTGHLKSIITQLAKCFETESIEDYAKLFVLLSYGLIGPLARESVIETADGYYDKAWNTLSLAGRDNGYLFAFIGALQPGHHPFAMAQLAMIVAQKGFRRKDFELKVQELEFGEEAVAKWTQA